MQLETPFDADQCAYCGPVVGISRPSLCIARTGCSAILSEATYLPVWVASFFPVAGWHTRRMGDRSVVLTPIRQSRYWRVKIKWPDAAPRYFGKFNSRTDAEQWIDEHRWLIRRQNNIEAADDH